MRIKKMMFEKNSFILSSNNGLHSVKADDQKELLKWLNERNISYSIASNILTLPREEDQTIFILRWLTE